MEIFMANGPLGGNMGTPPVPPQPPQVSFETTAQSRGNFNNFLKSMPNTTSMTPIPPMGSSPMMPTPNDMGNIDIFNEPVNMQLGGVAGNPLDSYGDYLSQQIDSTQVEPFIQEVQQMASQRFNLGSDSGGQSVFGPLKSSVFGPLKSFDASQPLMEIAEPLPQPSLFQRIPEQYPQDLSRPMDLSRPVETGEPLLSIFDSGINGFRPFNPPKIQDMMARPANPFQIKELGYQFNPIGLRGGPDMFNMIDQRIFNEGFMPGSTQLMGGLPRAFFDGGEVDDSDFGGFSDYGSVDATSDSNDNNNFSFSDDTVGDTSAGDFTVGDDSSNMGLDDDILAQNIIENALNQGTNQDSGSNNANIASRINSQIMGSEEDIFQDDINRDIAGSLTNRDATNMMPNASNFSSRVTPNVAGAFRGSKNASLLGPEDALINAITQGRSDLYAPFTNNPGNLKQAREDLTTQTIKGFNADGTPRTGPALFNTLEAGQKALDDQLSRYGNRGINTASDFVNTYLGTDIKENPLENKQGYLNAVNNAVGSNFDLSNAATRGNLMNAISRQELGQKGINALNNQVTASTGLDLTSLTPSNTRDIVDDAYTTDVPQVRTSITPDVVGSTDAELAAMDRAIANTQRVTDREKQLANVNNQTLSDRLQNQRGLDRNISTIPDTALETMAGRQDIFQPDNIGTGQQPVDTSLENMAGRIGPVDTVFDIDTTDTRNFVGDDFAPALDIVDARQEARQNALAEKDANVRDMDDIDRASAGRASDFPTLSTVPEDFEEKVGRDFNANRMADIERLYGEDIGQTKAGRGSDPTFFEDKGFTGTAGGVLDAIERKTRENMANEIALGRPMGLGETFFGFNAPDLRTQTMKDYMSNVQPNYDFGDFNQTSKSIPEKQLVRNNSGRVIGIRDASGRLVSGMDPNAPIDRGDDNNENPFILKPKPKEEKEEEDKPPNVIGGGVPTPVPEPVPTVVDSPFTSNVSDFVPSTFNTGDINKLIEMLTGVAAPKSMKKGGVAGYAEGGRVMQALDNLLATA